MKIYVKIIIISAVFGIILAFIFYKDIKKNVLALTNNDDIIYLFQTGVYKNIDNANNKLYEYTANKMFYYDNYYRIISSACYNKNTCNKLKQYFNDNNIEYYLKKYKINSNYIKELKKYEIMLNNTNNSNVIDNINNKINTLFLEYIT